MSDLFSAANMPLQRSGYKLDFFEMLNWGVFDKTIHRINCSEKSVLLTGKNGSGKTTFVDAIQTLLVPPQKRAYNSSSGTEIKRDRTEENYVLGASGEKIEDSDGNITRESIRDKDGTISILLGCFKCQDRKKSISLFQIRYFPNENMQIIYAFVPCEIDISKIQDTLAINNLQLDTSANPRWKKILKEKFKMEFFTSFGEYSKIFSEEFGFRDTNKALKLFSQIIGLKVLGGISKFIKENMLEENDAEIQYQNLYENYSKLLTSEKEIQKVKKQLELLTPVVDNSKKFRDAEHKAIELDNFRSTLPIWDAMQKEQFLSCELETYKNALAQKQSILNIVSEEIKTLEKEIISLENAIANDDDGRRIKEIENDISRLTEDVSNIKEKFSKYRERLDLAGIAIPKNEDSFLRARKTADELLSKKITDKNKIDKDKTDIAVLLHDVESKISLIKNELFSLGNRSSNIPLENIRIRQMIAKGSGCKESDLPFAGELIQVKKNEKLWEAAIEKVLHSFALDILVQPKFYKKVTEFIKTNNLKGRVVYLKTDGNFSLDVDSRKNISENMLPSKIEVKENHELYTWLKNYIEEKFDYVCTDDTNEFAESQKAVTSSALVKNKLRHEKDDRIQNSNRTNFVLGWNNEEKRRALSSELDETQTKRDDLQRKIADASEQLSKIENAIDNLKRIDEYNSWHEIDSTTKDAHIKQLTAEKKELLANSNKLKNLEKSLESKKQEKDEKKLNENSLLREIGSTEEKIVNIKQQITENSEILKPHFSNEETAKITNQNILLFEKRFMSDTSEKIQSLHDLNSFSKKIQSHIANEIVTVNGDKEKYRDATETAMRNVVSPRDKHVREKFGDWSHEFSHLECNVNFIDEFIATYDKLQKDDLPQYEERFREYFDETINAHVIDFNHYIKNSKEKISDAIATLNDSLRNITYEKNPATYLELVAQQVWGTDIRLKKFNSLLKKTIPDAASFANKTDDTRQKSFESIKNLIEYLKENETDRKFVLDVRNWFTFAAVEKYNENGEQKRYYKDSSSLSGGQKTKLTYTIIAAALEYQFGLTHTKSRKSFCFAIIDEAFSKIDAENSEQVMKLFEQLGIQLMVVTPDDKINVAEDYVSSVHIVVKNSMESLGSSILSLEIEEYKNERDKNDFGKIEELTQNRIAT